MISIDTALLTQGPQAYCTVTTPRQTLCTITVQHQSLKIYFFILYLYRVLKNINIILNGVVSIRLLISIANIRLNYKAYLDFNVHRTRPNSPKEQNFVQLN